MVRLKKTCSSREMLLLRARGWRSLTALLAFLLLSACGGTALPGVKPPPPSGVGMAQPASGWVKLAQNQPGTFTPRLSPNVTTTPTPRNMAPPPAPARPPTPGTQDFGHWQKEGNYFKWTPGQHPGPTPGPIWVPGHSYTDSNGNKAWSPGYWR